ncbi:hypothetical protein BGZ99_008851 [Dissophora globulifera]|uniref:HEAT repeat domain-containing protein n=1 Tax=Dissophora globulifera TaxID=979702 RepID=A0A9P6RB09_9FUNG|nr:hypothetical protein BGZ99_008851 [Dissophora globulifera]
MLKDESAEVRKRVGEALGKQSTLSEVAIQSLIGALKDEDADVGRRAAEALGKQSALSEVAIRSLIGALKDEDAAAVMSCLYKYKTTDSAITQSKV